MATSYGAVTATTSAGLLVASNPGRRDIIIYNNGSVVVYLGPDANVTAVNGIPILPQSNFTENGVRMYMGAWYAIAASATSDMRFMDYGE